MSGAGLPRATSSPPTSVAKRGNSAVRVSFECARSRRVDVATARDDPAHLQPGDQLEHAGLEREAVALDDRVVGRVPARQDRLDRITGAVRGAQQRRSNRGSCGRSCRCAIVASNVTPTAAAASSHARAASGSVSSISPSMSKITACGRRSSAGMANAAASARRASGSRPARHRRCRSTRAHGRSPWRVRRRRRAAAFRRA